ncbi:c-type cytochrome biogenesis protein CcmI [Ponticoccus sp. SC2-23]|uniref:c-type cytochrome biogenesis protein CcmI n=1 Tax=Alexandriicola marinus TaxID=2081710 RepID=UPI000FD70623|nr:c-type cytochrome biogenesis protein CcmI [Alexandriicola marinus]MBM1222406.1 c-type cytochrome biogenesis protein CcmI [Ponticoccus sp. SC6-9]MBM1224519.1 c-type cytochrome biogenesis protein CcmI [Ponticoccus sp. SC6-15]MBM1229701.1 c-type cytochrome biogenesis protein CcmI [Ponticoccus sp. SC6-38]MBM1233485.1 c-type cytochrome biogenesis protein CcmI [Ponticoccus sp. SC6-45]MBM1236565.1 c-type cytochrome biogenesis protein CcmI [Ponticoccus sp. SC6-49]MBM1244609.1 c-type cytochrome bio
MMFWIIAGLTASAVAVTLLLPLFRRQSDADADDGDLGIYRDQLSELDRDVARGVMDAEEAERARTEIARRLLTADKSARQAAHEAPRGATWALAGLSAIVLVGGGLFAYDRLGAPGYPDIPLAQRVEFSEQMRDSRISQTEAEARVAARRLAETGEVDPPVPPGLPQDYVTMVTELREIVPTRPEDLQGWELLSLHEARLGRFAAAARAQERVIALKGDAATAADKVALVDRLVAAADGFVSPEVDRIIAEILEQDRGNLAARYYTGLLYAQTDSPELAFSLWRQVVEQAGPGNVHGELARRQIEDVAFRAGIDYSLPDAPGPSAEDIAAAQDMSPEDRQQMIRGMVDSLSDRLATEGGSAEEWARLITALGVLGERERAEAIFLEGRDIFATDPASAETLRNAAIGAGIVGE